jgi:hypothetical protein
LLINLLVMKGGAILPWGRAVFLYNGDFRDYKYIMTETEFKEFMVAQKEAIEVAKWLLGEKLGRDPGQEFVMQWIRDNAENFRANWPSYSAEWRAKHG